MMRKMVITTFVSLMLAGCNSADPSALPEGGDDAQVRIKGDDGNEAINLSIGADLAVDLPKGYTVYPGAMVMMKSNLDQGDSTALVIMMSSDDSPEKVAAFYRNQAKAAGVEFSMENASGGTHVLMGKAPDGAAFSLSVGADESGTNAQLLVGVAKGN